MESLLNELRPLFLKNPTLTAVDHFQVPGSSSIKIESQWITGDPLDDVYIKNNTFSTFDLEKNAYTNDMTSTSEHESVVGQKYSPSGKFKVVFMMSSSGPVIEIFQDNILHLRKPIPASFHTGFIRSSVFMSSPALFSKDESRLMYMADDPTPSANVYKLKDKGVKRFKYRDSLGDRVQTHTIPSIFILDLQTGEIGRIFKPTETRHQRTIFLQPQFLDPTGSSIVCCSLNMVNATDQSLFTNLPKQLRIFKDLSKDNLTKGALGMGWEVKNEAVKGCEEEVIFFPKVSPSFSHLSYLSISTCPISAHNIHGLRLLDLTSFESKSVLEEQEEDGAEFAGINGNPHLLSTYDWSGENTIVFSSFHHQAIRMYEVDVNDKQVKRIVKDKKYSIFENEYFLATLAPGVILAKRDTLYRNGVVCVLRKAEDGTYTEYDLPNNGVNQEADKYFEEEVKNNNIEAAWYGIEDPSTPTENRPLILILHGGPHTIQPNHYTPFLYFNMKMGGHTVLNINYSGSNGRGTKFCKESVGKAGIQDAEEVYSFIQKFIEEKKCDPNQIRALCNDQGGFIMINLMKQYPKLFKAASLINPIVSNFSMLTGSENKGWIHSEVLGNDTIQEFDGDISDNEMLKLKDRSPMLGKFEPHTELMIFNGVKGNVVPSPSARWFYKKLRHFGHKVTLFEYPTEEHTILTISPQFDFTVKSVLLFSGDFY